MFIKPAILIILAVLLLIIAVFIAACSKHPFHHQSPEKKAEWVVKKISSELDLDESQNAKLEEIKSDILAKHQNFGGMKSEIWKEISTQVKSENINEEKLNALFADKEAQFKEMRTYLVTKIAEFHSILTPEQRLKLAEKMNDFHNFRNKLN